MPYFSGDLMIRAGVFQALSGELNPSPFKPNAASLGALILCFINNGEQTSSLAGINLAGKAIAFEMRPDWTGADDMAMVCIPHRGNELHFVNLMMNRGRDHSLIFSDHAKASGLAARHGIAFTGGHAPINVSGVSSMDIIRVNGTDVDALNMRLDTNNDIAQAADATTHAAQLFFAHAGITS